MRQCPDLRSSWLQWRSPKNELYSRQPRRVFGSWIWSMPCCIRTYWRTARIISPISSPRPRMCDRLESHPRNSPRPLREQATWLWLPTSPNEDTAVTDEINWICLYLYGYISFYIFTFGIYAVSTWFICLLFSYYLKEHLLLYLFDSLMLLFGSAFGDPCTMAAEQGGGWDLMFPVLCLYQGLWVSLSKVTKLSDTFC